MQYRCLTLNVKGINHNTKREHIKLFNQIDIAMLQKTHLTDNVKLKIEN